MSAHELSQQLTAIGQRLARWQAELRAVFWGALVIAALWLFGLIDLLGQLGMGGRVGAWLILVAITGVGLWRVLIALSQQRSPEAVAARLEQAFPQLDNHLINYVQLAATATGDNLARAYLDRGLPEWSVVDVEKLRDRRRQRYTSLALGVAILLTALPLCWTRRAWTNALARVLNPFSTRAAASLAQLLAVSPGNHEVTSGAPLTFSCKATGQKGQKVWLDLWPVDDKPSNIDLGVLGTTQDFSYTLPKVTAALAYRFRAGDARSDRFQVAVVPPLALTGFDVTIHPPSYTGLAEQTVNALTTPVVAPAGAELSVALRGNRPLTGATVADVKAPTPQAGGSWTATVPIAGRAALPIRVTAANGEKLETALAVQLLPDKQPTLRIIAPTTSMALAPGATARVEAEIADDYGVEQVWLETEAGERVTDWQPNHARTLPVTWTGGPGKYRLVARDHVQQVKSPLLVFEVARPHDVVAEQARNASQTAASLARLVALQKQNLERTVSAHESLIGRPSAAAPSANPPAALGAPSTWPPLADTQRSIRQLSGVLLADPRKPLGALVAAVSELHSGAMLEAIDVLERVPKVEAGQQPGLALRALGLETTILRVLAATQQGLDRVERHRQVSDLLALLDALVSGQEDLLKRTKPLAAASQPASTELIGKQDRLSGDVTDFTQACQREVERLQKTEPDFTKLILQVAAGCQQRAVAADMLRAAERLEAKKTGEALPLEERALTALKEFQTLLNHWRVADAKKTMEDVRQVVADSKAKFAKLVKLQSKVVETMRAVQQQKDLTKPDAEEFLEELKALKANIKDAALKIADDLHIFPELPVGNAVVTDIQQVFEEVKQVPGSESAPATELGLQKEDFILEMMEGIKKRFDDMEMWLTAKPDNVKRLTENFDQTEMPKMAVIDLPKELDDIIGELQKQEDKIRDKSDDSATNQAAPDLPMGWDVGEGETSTFSGKGKSGNERPDHKEQDGRSLVGREGEANGETVAGSGKINEGDKKIENRMTRDSAQAGHVAEEDHVDAKSTGGGKQSGWADQFGMAGQGPRRDSNLPPSLIGLQAMLRRNAEALYARATMLHIRTGSLDEAVHAMHGAEEAMQQGAPIQRVKEFQRRASVALQRAQLDLGGGFHTDSLNAAATAPAAQDQLAGVPDEAPTDYRDLVAEYFKSLSAAP